MAKFSLKLYNYDKPGKGVEKDENKGPKISQFFKLFGRKFVEMFLMNLIIFACALPAICWVFRMILINNTALLDSLSSADMLNSYPWVGLLTLLTEPFTEGFLGIVGVILVAASAIAFGPLTAGFVFCLRNAARDEHIWISDIFTYAWRNWKQALPVGILDIVVVVACCTYMTTDLSATMPMAPWILAVMQYGALILGIMYFALRYYVYTIMVTFDMKLTDIFRNAFMLMFGRFVRALIILGATFAILYLNIIFPLPSIFLLTLIDISFCGFIGVFCAYGPIDEFMVQPALKEKFEAEERAKKRSEN